MTDPGPVAEPRRDSLPAGLWVGTVVFMIVAAGLLILAIRMGRSQLVGSADKAIEKQAVEPK